jgi:hypothetical protein
MWKGGISDPHARVLIFNHGSGLATGDPERLMRWVDPIALASQTGRCSSPDRSGTQHSSEDIY